VAWSPHRNWSHFAMRAQRPYNPIALRSHAITTPAPLQSHCITFPRHYNPNPITFSRPYNPGALTFSRPYNPNPITFSRPYNPAPLRTHLRHSWRSPHATNTLSPAYPQTRTASPSPEGNAVALRYVTISLTRRCSREIKQNGTCLASLLAGEQQQTHGVTSLLLGTCYVRAGWCSS
jgi:hypothetical protein